MNLYDLLYWFKTKPHEAERLNQCFNCKQLLTCQRGDESEDENLMCKYFESVEKPLA